LTTALAEWNEFGRAVHVFALILSSSFQPTYCNCLNTTLKL